MNLNQLPFFYYGSATPVTSKYSQYGLYNPVANRFVLVHSDADLLNIVAKLFSSRYTLILCRLDCAENFQENLIDNLVCLKWTFEGAGNSRFTAYIRHNGPVTYVKQLTPVSDSLDSNNLLIVDQPYFHYALHWADKLTTNNDYLSEECGADVGELIDIPIQSSPSQRAIFRKEVYQIIYQTFNFDQAKLKIEELKNNYDLAKLNLRID